MIFAVIDPERALNLPGMKMETFQYFGIEDSIINHLNLNRHFEKGESQFQKGESLLNKRKF